MSLLLIDGNSIVNRAFYGIRHLSTKDGQFTNGIYGFLNTLLKLREDVSPDGIVVAFDLPEPTFRHKQYAEYKVGRKPMPSELASQLPILKEILELMGCSIVELGGYEADDILGTISNAVEKQEKVCNIATGDRDSLQLVSDQVTVLLSSTKAGQPVTIIYNPSKVKEQYGLTPKQMLDLKALMGDSSDNIPGVAGVGEKTALTLLHDVGSLDNIYNDLDSLDITDNLRKRLKDGKDDAYMSKKLNTIYREVPIDTDTDNYLQKPIKQQELASMLASLELFTFIERLGLSDVSTASIKTPKQKDISITIDTSFEDLSKYVSKENCINVVVGNQQDMEDVGLYATFNDNENVVFAVFDNKVLKVNQNSKEFKKIIDFLENESIEVVTNDLKALCNLLIEYNSVPTNIVMDTMLAGYLLNPLASEYTLPRLAQEYKVQILALKNSKVDDEKSSSYCLAASLPALANILKTQLKETHQFNLLVDVEIPLAIVLANMENVGVAVNAKGIEDFGNMLQNQIQKLEINIWDLVGYEFNLNSPKQLSEALFDKLGLPPGRRTKTGYSTNAEVLEGLRHAHPAVSMLLDYRQLAKLKSTYCDGLLRVIAGDGRIHSSFNQAETRTGRISSTEPNLQNIPVRTELGRELRKFFIAKPGWLLCDADYSQIELRVLAHMSQDSTMLAAFNDDVDIHTVTASQVFGIGQSQVSQEMRSQAKAVNFGIIYGIGPHSLSKDIDVSYSEAKKYIDDYLTHYQGVNKFINKMIEDAKQTGYAKTLFDRRRPLPELKASNANTRRFGERVARNMPIQGTAADIIKIAMIRVSNRLIKENMKSRLILQVHDELIVEAPEDEASKAAQILQEEMESAADLTVKLEVDVSIGKNWYDTKL